MENRYPRQDAWTNQEEETLTKIMLEYIGAGETQLAAFQEASRQIPLRTPEACGFRWNATLRNREYINTQIAKAKQTARELKRKKIPVKKVLTQIIVPQEIYKEIERVQWSQKPITYNTFKITIPNYTTGLLIRRTLKIILLGCRSVSA